ncbi:hypothetical protein [Agrilactobacillus composti]|jgi:hypothetical protein|nr:hypothetical protein [Agrilactobacillus composti]MCH4171343.1 hypothetical protein [Lactobacillus sp.]
MSQNTHTGVSNNRRPVNSKKVKARRNETEKVLEFVKKRAELDTNK